MTKEWQEATNEYLKVRSYKHWILLVIGTTTVTDHHSYAEREIQPNHWYQQRGLHWERLRAESAGEEALNTNLVENDINWLQRGGEVILLVTAAAHRTCTYGFSLRCQSVSRRYYFQLVLSCSHVRFCMSELPERQLFFHIPAFPSLPRRFPHTASTKAETHF